MLAGCTSAPTTTERTEVKDRSNKEDDVQILYVGKGDYSDDIYKFSDGNTTCYYYNGNMKGDISCLREATSSAGQEEHVQN